MQNREPQNSTPEHINQNVYIYSPRSKYKNVYIPTICEIPNWKSPKRLSTVKQMNCGSPISGILAAITTNIQLHDPVHPSPTLPHGGFRVSVTVITCLYLHCVWRLEEITCLSPSQV